MTSLWLPAGIIAASLALTYFFCVRPMRQGHVGTRVAQSSAERELDLAVRQARADLEQLRSGASGEETAPPRDPRPSAEPKHDARITDRVTDQTEA